MKKILLFAAVAAMSVGAFADISSANIVGYANKTSNTGFTFYTPQFKEIGNDAGVNIQSIKLGEGATSWSDNVQIFDSESVVITTYYFATADESGLEADGWLNEGADALADVTIQPGQSVLIFTEAGVSVQNAGEVLSVATVKTGVAGFNAIGNMSPSSISIQDIKLDVAATSWSDNIQFLDAGSVIVATYYYATADESGLEADGWLNEGADALADVTIGAGEGCFVYLTEDGVKVTLPSAL